jgi:hypothetical protein
MAVVVSVALASAAPRVDDKLREVGVLAPLAPAVQWSLKKCGFEGEAVLKIVESELEQQGFRVVARDEKPRGGEVRVQIMVVERKDGLAAWSVHLELRERAQLERDPTRPAAALSWDGPGSLTIGKSTSLCRDVEKNLRSSVRQLAEDRRKESPSNP